MRRCEDTDDNLHSGHLPAEKFVGVGDRSRVPYDGDSDVMLCGVVGISVGVLSHLFSERKVAEEVPAGTGITEKNNAYIG